MTSTKQITANQNNALKGGVKTLEGKIRSRMNARKHGILANLLLDNESDYVESMKERLLEDYKPESLYEQTLVEMMAIYRLRLNRLLLAETEMVVAITNPREYDEDKNNPLRVLEKIEHGNIVDEGYKPLISSQHIEKLNHIYLRYETNILRGIMRMHKELSKTTLRR